MARYADNPYPRMRYDEAVETLQGMGIDIEWGQDLDYSKEKVLTADFDVPHFLTHYPKVAKPFYHRVDPEDDAYVLCHDLLAPEGYGEIIGGGERTWSEEEILARIDEENVPREPYQFYIDTRAYGGWPTAVWPWCGSGRELAQWSRPHPRSHPLPARFAPRDPLITPRESQAHRGPRFLLLQRLSGPS